jgi:hypothetical protein
MIDVGQSEHEVDRDCDLHTYGLGPCVGIVVGYSGKVSMLHAPMPNGGGAEDFFDELCAAIPEQKRAQVRPILAGAMATFGRIDAGVRATRKWVEFEMVRLGFGVPHVHWGDGALFGGHSMTTCIENGTVEIMYEDLEVEAKVVAVVPLW